MKRKVTILSITLILSGSLYATGTQTVVPVNGTQTNSLNNLIQKMNNVNVQDKYKYMNEIKDKISQLSENNKADKFHEALNEIEKDKETQQQIGFNKEKEHNNNLSSNGDYSSSDSGGDHGDSGGDHGDSGGDHGDSGGDH